MSIRISESYPFYEWISTSMIPDHGFFIHDIYSQNGYSLIIFGHVFQNQYFYHFSKKNDIFTTLFNFFSLHLLLLKSTYWVHACKT